jgi:membrane associated rhomboid family serine protease
MIPLRADNETRSIPWLTAALVAVNVAVFVWMLRLGGSWVVPRGTAVDAFIARFAFVPARLTADPTSIAVWATMLTAMFLHAGWVHIAFNMLYLWIFGPAVESRLGRAWYLPFYLACGVAATLAQWWFARLSPVPVVGASGAIAGVLGAFLVLAPKTGVTTIIPLPFFLEVATLPAWIVILVFFVLQLASAIASLGDPAAGGIAFFAHVGGFLFGLALAVPIAVAQRGRRRLHGDATR